ncbi:putative peroxisomal sarcosine oxidase [Kockovaella imperatae]|uniref:Putative peroxisomal sarcosine oxidase n=1 Tax=Kockovaella imperatae TaxID=4999 RepID=A0A1Y1UCC7_9TREE|nr:putative peroxisomal sarcosine oxidase [Kockovaella imperatae]ORX35174.1 putative peroxisomal sarcosine oxidase [Kockovaella imperatae]
MDTSQSSKSRLSRRPLVSDKHARIIIIGGGGTMGSSTALHLARRGYTNIQVLDVWESPSNDSAGNDINKIAGADSIGLFGGVSDEAWEAWVTDPIFRPYAHNVGKLDLTVGSNDRAAHLNKKYEKLRGLGRTDVDWMDSADAIKRKAPHLEQADITGWQGLWCANGGWVAARQALSAVAVECRRLGVKCASGESGTFRTLVLDSSGRCTGVEVADGTIWEGDLIVLAAGAWSPVLVDLEGQCESKAWIYAHIQLTPEESQAWKGIPTMYNDLYGFFMEPQPGTGLLKLCNEFPGYTHMALARPFPLQKDIRMSVPRSHTRHPTDTIPDESREDIKQLIDKCLPHLRGRPLINQGMCWCTDTEDANWLLCEHPKLPGLVLATGDSGHTFKMLPVVGSEVADLIEDKLSDTKRHLWRWRPGAGDPNGTGEGGPRPKDLSDVEGWRSETP